MARSEAQRAAQRRYIAKTYDDIRVQLRKGTKDNWKQAAASRGLSLAGFVLASVDEYIANHPV